MATRNEDIILRNLRNKYEGTSKQKKLQEEKEKEDMNFFEHFLATTGSIYNAVEKGVIKGAEGILDLGTGLLSGAGNLMGIDTTELDKFTATDLTQKLYDSEFKQYLDQYLKPITTGNIPQIIHNYGGSVSRLFQGKNPFEINNVVKANNSGEYLPSIVQQVGETAGNMLVIAGTAGLGGGAGTGIATKLGASAGSKALAIGSKIGQFGGTMLATSGGGIEQALQEGGNIGEALGYGLGQGAVEATSEAVLGWGIGKAVKGVSKTISKVAPKLSSVLNKAGSTISKGKIAGILGKSGTGNTLARFAKNFGEEGMEEIFSSALDPVLQKLTYNKDKSIQEIFEANGGVDNLVESFLLGGFMGGAFEGVSTIGGALRTGSLKNYNLEIEYGNLVEIDEQMKQIFKQEETESNNRKLGELELQREEQIKKIQDKFGEYINDQIKQNQADPNYKSNRTNYVKNLKAEMDYLTNTDYRVRALQDVVGPYTLVSETNEGASYSTKSGMEIKISKSQLERIKNGKTTIQEVLAHEVAHQFITDKVLNNKIISNEELMEKVYKKNKVSNLDELYYKKQSEGYNDNMVRTSKEYSDYIEQGLSKEEAFERAKRDYLNEEIVADVLFGNYYKSLNEIQQLIQGREEKGLKRLLSTIRRKYGNKEANARPKDYNEIIALIKSNIASNKERYTKQLKEKLEENVKKKTDKKYKLDSQGNELTEEQQEFFKDSKVRDKNGSLMIMYHSSNSKFTIFDLKFSNLNDGKLQGFWLTSNPNQKNAYGNNVIESYVNITNPINRKGITLNKEQIRLLAEARGFKNIKQKQIQDLLESGEISSDYDLIKYFAPETDNNKYKEYITRVEEITGYDGYILDDYDTDAIYAIAFNSNQIKSIDNKKPTKSSDIRYKLDDDFLEDFRKENLESVTTEVNGRKVYRDNTYINSISEIQNSKGEQIFKGRLSYLSKYYNFKKVDLHKLAEDTKVLDNEGVEQRRTNIWGSDKTKYVFDPLDERTTNSPIQISIDENGKYKIKDGNHRIIALLNEGFDDAYLLVEKQYSDKKYKLDSDPDTEKRKKRLLDRIGRVEQYIGNPSVYEAYKTVVEYINQLDSISAQDNLELGRTLAKYEKAFKEGKPLEEETTIQPKETTKVESKEAELSKEEIERQQAEEMENKNKNISNKIIDNSKKASEIYQSAKNNSLDKQLEALEQLIILRENTIKLYDKYKRAFEGNKSGLAISAIEDLGAYIYIDLNESQADRTIEYKIENIEKSILEKQLKPKSEKKINIKETQKVEKIIKNVRTLVKIDSAETVILRANMKNDKIYRKERAKDLFALINSSFERNKRNNFRLRFNKGYELAQNRVFEVLNNTTYTDEQKADIIRDIILEGVEVKALDYDPDTLMSRGRKVYTPINAWNVDEKVRANVYTKLDGMIKGILTIGGEPSELAKKVQKIAENYEKTNERLNTQLDTQIEENKKLLEEIKKQKEALKEMKAKDKASQKEIDKMIKKLERAEINYSILSKTKGSMINQLKDKNANLSRTITELKAEIKSLKAKLKTTTSRLAKAQSQAYGKKTLPKNFRNEIIEPIKSIDENFDLTNEQYLKIADLFSKGKIQEAFDLYMEALGEAKISDNTKINDLKGSSLYSEISTDIREYLELVYNNAEASINQKLKNKLANVKKFYREQLEIERAIKTITNKSKSLAKKVKNQQPGIVPQIATQIQGLVDIFTKVSKTSLNNGSIRTRLAEFLNVYKGINPAEINGAMLPEFVVDTIEDISSIDPSEKLTMEELKQYKDIVNAISKYINTASGDIEYDIDGNGQKVKIKEVSKQGITQQKTIREKIKSAWRKFWYFVSPRLVFEGIDEYQDNGIYSRLFKMLQRGELKFQENYLDLIKPFIEFEKNNKSFMKSLNKKVEIGKFKGTKAQALYIYLLAQDIDGYQHMMHSGIQVEKGQAIDFKKEEIIENVLDENGNQVLYEKGKNKGKPKTTTRYESAELDQFIQDIYTTLNLDSEVAKKYIEITQDFFDNKSRKLKYDTDIELYSVSNVKNAGEHYVPIRVSNLDINKNLDDKTFNTNGLQGVLNYSFNKNRTANLGKVSVQGINELVYSHARSVAQYSGYAVPINALNQTYNYRNENGESLGAITKERLGADNNTYYLDDYINSLLRDWQGIKGGKTKFSAKINSFIGTLRGKFAKYQLGFNLKVVISQLSSLPASLRYIETKNLIGASKLRMKNLPPIPALAEYRKLDNSVAQTQAMTLVGKANKGLDKIADAGSKGITWMDTKVMNQIWKASLLQTRNADGSWNIEKATELFNMTATETQPMYNALERSALQRADNELTKSILMFTAQPLQNLSILIEIGARARAKHRMGQKLTKEDKTLARKSIIALLSQGAMYTAITMLFKYLLDKDDKPEEAMDWVVQYVNDNIIGMIPLVNSISLKYDENKISLDRNNFELSWLTQFNDAINSLGNVTDSSLTLEKRVKSFTESFGMFTGIPTRNLYNYTIGLTKQWIEPVYEFDAKWSGNINSKTSINNALDKGSNKKSKAYFNAYNKNILDLNENTLNALYDLYKEDRSSALKSIPSTFTLENEIIPVDQVKFKQTYSKVEKQLNVVNLGVFKRSKNETKEYVVSKLINTYYSLAKKEQLGQELNKFELLATTRFDLGRNLIYLGEIERIEATLSKSRKQLVEQYINRLPLQASMKYVLFALAGYSIPDSKKQSVKLLLRQFGMKSKYIEQFLD